MADDELVPQSGANAPFSNPEIISKFLALQAQEIAIKQGEIEIRKQESSQSFEFAKESIHAQERDRKHEREYRHKFLNGFLLLTGGIVTALVGVIITALWLDKVEVVREIVQALICVAGGYALGFAKIGSSLFARDEMNTSPLDD